MRRSRVATGVFAVRLHEDCRTVLCHSPGLHLSINIMEKGAGDDLNQDNLTQSASGMEVARASQNEPSRNRFRPA